MKSIRYGILYFLLMGISTFGFSQGKTYKLTKEISREIDFAKGKILVFNGERTFIQISTWGENYVDIKAVVDSRYEDEKIANEDLEKIEVRIERKGNTIYYSNRISLDKDEAKPKSNLRVNLQVYLPEGLSLEVNNSFGENQINGLFKDLNIVSNFSPILLSEVKANLKLNSNYGDTDIIDFEGSMNIGLEKSNIMLRNISGELELEVNYGEVDYFYSRQMDGIKIEANYSPLNLIFTNNNYQKFRINCKECAVQSKGRQIKVLKNDFIIESTSDYPEAQITSRLEDVKIIFENNQTNNTKK